MSAGVLGARIGIRLGLILGLFCIFVGLCSTIIVSAVVLTTC